MSGDLGREIEFRGKHKLDGKWVVGNLVKMFGEWCIQNPNNENEMHIVHRETVGQYTGIRDKKGVKIYEDDIVKRVPMSPFSVEMTGVVIMAEGCWYIDSGEDGVRLFDEVDENEAIGNDLENTKFLEGK